jgi:hypothetical protein
MKLRTILMTLILGTSTVAVAQPHQPYSPRNDDRRGHVDVDIDRWVPLASGVRARDGQMVVSLGKRAGRFDRFQLRVDTGSVFVRRFTVMYKDRSMEKIDLNRRLRAGEVLDVDVPGRGRVINRLIITPARAQGWRNNGRFSISGKRPDARQYGWRDHWRKYYDDGSYDRR